MNDPKAFDFDTSALTWWESLLIWVCAGTMTAGLVWLAWRLL